MNKEEAARLCVFFRRSHYDIVQARYADGWGPAWTFAPCDLIAAVRAALMLRRAGVREFRHARRARIIIRHEETVEAVVITCLPERSQKILRLTDSSGIHGLTYLRDESLRVFENFADERCSVGSAQESRNIVRSTQVAKRMDTRM